MRGYFSIAYSPDDEAECGKGYYAELWWEGDPGPLFRTSAEAIAWAVDRGGLYLLTKPER